MTSSGYRLVPLFGCCLLWGCVGTVPPSRQDPSNYTLVESAVENCDLSTTARLVGKNHLLIYKRGWGNDTLLHLAAQNRCPDVAQYLLKEGAVVDARADGGTTPLHVAAEKGTIQVASLLLAAGASVNATDSKHRTPLDRAIAWDQLRMASFLKSQGGHSGLNRTVLIEAR